MTSHGLDHAIQSGFDGALTEAECLELRDTLKSDPAARALYYEYAALQQSLIFRISRYTPISSARSLADIRQRIESRRSVRLAFVAAAAVLIALGVVLQLTRIHIPETPALATFRGATGSLYSIAHPDDGKGLSPGELDVRSAVNLTQGTFEFTLRNGIRGVVLAPAKFEFRSEKEMRFWQGTAWFEVSEEGKGFRVRTPDLAVTDLGTIFGILADPESGDEVHVFSGSVRVRGPRGAEETLGAGQARLRAPAGFLKTIPPKPGSFLTRLPEGGSTGLIINGDFEMGTDPEDANYGQEASAALLPGWNFGRDVGVSLRSKDGMLGHGGGENNIVSPTADVQVGFRNAGSDYEVGTLDDSIWQTFSTVPLREYEVSFEMGGYFHNAGDLRITAMVYDGIATSGASLGHISEGRSGSGVSDNGYNPRVGFTFTARSGQTTLVLTETSPNSDLATPAIDNIVVTELRANDPLPEK